MTVAPDCPLKEKEATEAVSGMLIRSRVKPLTGNEYWTQPLLLDVQLDCLKSESIYDRADEGNAVKIISILVDTRQSGNLVPGNVLN